MIGVVIRDLPYLKLLHPICERFKERNVPFIIYHWDAHRGMKEYNRASLVNLNKSSPGVVKAAKKVKAFANDNQLLQQLAHDRITKMVSVEIWLWAKGHIKWLKEHKVKTYSVLYLSDALWLGNPKCITDIDKTYYTAQHIMDMHHEFLNLKNTGGTFLGSPLFDPIENKPSDGDNILVMLPNGISPPEAGKFFGSAERFTSILDKLAQSGNLIFKARRKQWLPEKYAKEVIFDGDIIYPPVMSELLKKCNTTVMFCSSGIYECVYGGTRVLNIMIPLKKWPRDQAKMAKYFSTEPGNLYQFDGVTETINQDVFLGDWKFKPKQVDAQKRKAWVEKFIGSDPADGAIKIADDIMKG